MKKNIFLSITCFLLLSALIFVCLREDYPKRIVYRLNNHDVEYLLNNTEESPAISSWTDCIRKLDIDVDVCFFGDSLTRWSDFSDIGYFTDKKLCNLGLSGASLLDMYQRADVISYTIPEKIFLQGG